MKTLAVTVVSAALVALAGCASPAAQPPPSASATPAGAQSSSPTTPTATPQPLKLTGKWKQSNSKSKDAWQQITIKKDTIEILWISDGGDTKSLYWVGTFTAPKTTEDAYVWTSKRDRKKTRSAFLASTAKSKRFNYAAGVLSYEVSLMGTTTTVKAERV